MRNFYILYDPDCGLCTEVKRWLARQPSYFHLHLVPHPSDWSRAWFPALAAPGGRKELIAIHGDGRVRFGDRAWIMCLWALRDYRAWARRLSRPALLPLARQAFAVLSRNRHKISHWFRLLSETELAEALRQSGPQACSR